VSVLHPLEVVRQIRKLAQNPVVATEGEVKVFMDSTFKFNDNNTKRPNVLFRELGSVQKETCFTFSFSPNAPKKEKKKEAKSPQYVPFQLQFTYTGLDGGRYLRVISTNKPTTTIREEAEESLDVAVLAAAHIQRISQLLKDGDSAEAYLQFRALYLLFQQKAVSDQQCEEMAAFIDSTMELDSVLQQLSPDWEKYVKSKGKESKKGKEEKEKEMNDIQVEVITHSQNVNHENFFSGERKRTILNKRKGDKELDKAYYEYKFEF